MIKKHSLFKYELFSNIFIIIAGILLHFGYEWSSSNFFIGSFCSVNESVWEHLKLIFVPTLIVIIIGTFYNKEKYPDYLSYKTSGLIYSLLFTVIFYYTYTGVLGYNITFLDISSFFIAIIVGEIVTIKNLFYGSKLNNKNSLYILSLLTLAFIIFTYFPLKIGLFQDPITKTYGMFKIKNI